MLIGLVAAGILFGGSALYVLQQLQDRIDASGPHNSQQVIRIESGMSARAISKLLVDQGALRADDQELFLRFITQRKTVLKAGEFAIPARASLDAIATLLASNNVVSYKVTIPEGLTIKQIERTLDEVEGLEGNVTTWPPEGWLFPDTYHFQRGDTRQQVVDRMHARMQKVVEEIWQQQEQLPNYLATQADLVTLASVIERETGGAAERELVSSVFHNRLRIGMALQSDPTIIYYESEKLGVLDHDLKRAQMQRKQPYNSYINTGLPPTAIANPGRAALEATLNPRKNKLLYFVADAEGGHRFAETYQEHRRNINLYRRTLRQQRAAEN